MSSRRFRLTPVTEEEFARVTSSNTTQLLPSEEWPASIEEMKGLQEVYGVGYEAPRTITSDGTSVEDVRGNLDVVREDGGIFKSYRYLYLRRADGYFRVGDFKDLDYGHHRLSRPDLLDFGEEERSEGDE